MPELREKLLKAGSEHVTSTPEELSQRIADATQQFVSITPALGIEFQ